MIMQVIQAAHAGRADRDQLGCARILREQIVKQTGVVQIFRDGDLELLLLLRPAAEGHRRIDKQQQAHHNAGHDRDADVAHAGREAERHGEEDAGDVARRAGRGAEADKAERAGHRNACAEVAVNEQDDDLHHRGQQRERHRHGLRTGVFIHIYRRDERAERQRRDQADGERGGRDAGGQNRTK